MNRETLILPTHLARQALVYVRQSTAKQLVQHQESTRRQYQLTETAQRLGWPQPRIQVIDDDLGLSGATSTQRLGFQRLVAAISLGEVGIVLVTEVSRPRMRGGLLNKARRGALALRLPVGLRRLGDGSVVQDPDDQVRAILQTLFTQFALLKTGRAVQRYFRDHQLQMPRYMQSGPDAGRLYWVRPTYQMIQQVLTNPAYAGIFVYGRRIQQMQPGDPPRITLHRRLIDEWEIVVPDVYPGYITEAQYYANRETLYANLYNFTKRRLGAPREGAGLLVGILLCGRCGRRMTPSYSSDSRVYHCRWDQITYDLPKCQSFPQRPLDALIQELFFEAVQPARLETLLTALDALEQERQALDRQWQLKLERARYAVQLAQRQYDAVDPDNRLVARELETRWNTALATLETLEQEYAAARRADLAPLSAAEQQAVRQLAHDLPAVWDAPTTTPADRKRLLRLAVQEVSVTVRQDGSRSADVAVLWSGGVTTHHTVTCPPPGWHCVTTAALVARIGALAQTLPDDQIAEHLNADGLCTQTGKPWTYQRVKMIRKQHAIPTACPIDPEVRAVRGDGMMPVRLAAERLGVSPSLIHVWIGQGVLRSVQRTVQSYRWVHLSEADHARLDGQHDWSHFPRVREVMRREGWSRAEVWERVRAGQYVAYRHATRQRWEWRLQATNAGTVPQATAGVV